MSNAAYEVHVSTTHHYDGNYDTFSAVEIIPPISKALAELACKEVEGYCDKLYEVDNPGQSADLPPKVSAYGFCDEGATVNTVLRFETSPSLEGGGKEALDNSTRWLARFVEKIVSPSGAAIAK